VGYKGFELSFLFQGSFGGEIANNNVRYLGTWDNGRNFFASMYNYWRSESEPGDGKHFKPTVNYLGLQKQFSSYWVEDASFIRLRNVRVSYGLPAKWTNKLKVSSAGFMSMPRMCICSANTPVMILKTLLTELLRTAAAWKLRVITAAAMHRYLALSRV
jgi:hypothetical protein